MAGSKQKSITTRNFFGKRVDYYLLSVKTPVPFFQLANAIAEHCHCTFSVTENLKVPKTDRCTMQPEFPVLYAQLKTPIPDNSFAIDAVDRLNIILFQNRTSIFDKSQTALATDKNKGLFSYQNDGGECYAFHYEGIKIGKCSRDDYANYYILIFAKKNSFTAPFVAHVEKLPDFTLVNRTSIFTKEETNAAHKRMAEFFSFVFNAMEKRIQKNMRNAERQFIGKIPNALETTPLFIPEIPILTNLPKFDISINNL